MKATSLLLAGATALLSNVVPVTAAPSAVASPAPAPVPGPLTLKQKRQLWNNVVRNLNATEQARFLQESTFDRMFRFLKPEFDSYPYGDLPIDVAKDQEFMKSFVDSLVNILPTAPREFNWVVAAYTNSLQFWQINHPAPLPTKQPALTYAEMFLDTWHLLTDGEGIDEAQIAPKRNSSADAVVVLLDQALESLNISGNRKAAVQIIQTPITDGKLTIDQFNQATSIFMEVLYVQAVNSAVQIDRTLIQRWAKSNFHPSVDVSVSDMLSDAALAVQTASRSNRALEVLGRIGRTQQCTLNVTEPSSTADDLTLVDFGFAIEKDEQVTASLVKLVQFDAFVQWLTRLRLEISLETPPQEQSVDLCIQGPAEDVELIREVVDESTIQASAYVNACEIPTPIEPQEIVFARISFYGQSFFAPLPYVPYSSVLFKDGDEGVANDALMTPAQATAFEPCRPDSRVSRAVLQSVGLFDGQIAQTALVADTEIASTVTPTTDALLAQSRLQAAKIDSFGFKVLDLDSRLAIVEEKLKGSAKALTVSAALPLSLVGTAGYLFL